MAVVLQSVFVGTWQGRNEEDMCDVRATNPSTAIGGNCSWTGITDTTLTRMLSSNLHADMKKDRCSGDSRSGGGGSDDRDPALIGIILPTMCTPRGGRKVRELDGGETPQHQHRYVAEQSIGPLVADDRGNNQEEPIMGLLGGKEATFESKIKAERPKTFNIVEVAMPMPTRFYLVASPEKPLKSLIFPKTPSTPGEQKKLLSRRVIYLNDNLNNFNNINNKNNNDVNCKLFSITVEIKYLRPCCIGFSSFLRAAVLLTTFFT